MESQMVSGTSDIIAIKIEATVIISLVIKKWGIAQATIQPK